MIVVAAPGVKLVELTTVLTVFVTWMEPVVAPTGETAMIWLFELTV